jgi:phosphoribosylanthranilate isomerase
VSVDTRLDALEAAPGGVESFKGRTGAVLPAAGDYNAQQTTFAPVGAITATNVQDAIAYVEANTLSQGDLDAHINQATNAHAATAIGFAPAGGIVATNVQAAIEEVKATVRLGSMPFYDTSGALKPIANI